MTIDMKLIFGIRTPATVALTITTDGQLPLQPPDLRIMTSGQDAVIPCSKNTWAATLEPGDHVVCLPAPGDSWFDAPLVFTLSAPATIVIPGATTSAPLVTWTATVGASASDSKNPWPPPLLDQVDTAPLSDPTWLASTLTNWRAQLSVERSAPSHAPSDRASQPSRFR